MTLKGFTVPLTPQGKSALATLPPWHYSSDCIAIEYWANPDAIQTLLPFSGHGAFASALGTNPHSEFIRPLDMIAGYSAVTLTSFKFL